MSTVEPVSLSDVRAVHRSTARPNRWRSRDVLGLAWLHGTLHISLFRRQALVGSWASSSRVSTIEEFEAAFDVAVEALGFSGSEVFLVLEHEVFVHQAEYGPAFSEAAARTYLRGRVERYEKEREPVLWISQRTVSARQEAAFLLHMLPSAFYGRLNGLLLTRRLELTRILPLVVPLQLILESSSTPKDQPVLVVAEAGDATTLMVSRAGELVFARTMLARWDADPGRIAVEVNRSLLYAKQQFGTVVEHIHLVGAVGEQAQGDVRARCGADKQVTVRSAGVEDWLQAVAKLSQRHPVNLVVGYLGRKRRQQFLRRSLLAGCWLGFGLMALDAWSRAENWREQQTRLVALATSQTELESERSVLEKRNTTVAYQNELVRRASEERLPPVPTRFLAFLGTIRPNEMLLTDFTTKWDPSTQKWAFRLEGQIEGDEESVRETLATFEKTIARSALKARFSEGARSLVPIAGADAGSLQRFSVEGGLLED